ncbi:MAG: 6,7-dimethyl-8-ribityllumazine synthase [Actinobacteria bacterium]|nr:6,7-dimethyl-8-ribityllumazine synthase [Actinomycetota bacterium]
MAKDVRAETRPQTQLDGTGLRIAVVASRFNDHVTLRLLDGARRGLADLGVTGHVEYWVPGAFELPFAAKTLATSGTVDGVVCVGCVIRGETSHYEEVAGQCAAGIQQAQLDTGVPIAFGVLTTEDLAQSLARSEGPGGHNVGEQGAHVVVEMARLVESVRATSTAS